MTTTPTAHDDGGRLRELEERKRSAWEGYRASLSELDGPAYEEAELISWERLQRELGELADERERLAGAPR